MQSLIGDKLIKRTGEEGSYQIAEMNFDQFPSCDYVCFYFGAHWAPPSRIFTTTLIEKFYNVVNEGSKRAEVIFVSDDREKSHFDRNFLKMPWWGIPFEDEHKKQTLKSKFGLLDLPTLVVVSTKDCRVVTHEGREHIPNGMRALDEWAAIVEQQKNDGFNKPEETKV